MGFIHVHSNLAVLQGSNERFAGSVSLPIDLPEDIRGIRNWKIVSWRVCGLQVYTMDVQIPELMDSPDFVTFHQRQSTTPNVDPINYSRNFLTGTASGIRIRQITTQSVTELKNVPIATRELVGRRLTLNFNVYKRALNIDPTPPVFFIDIIVEYD